MVKYVVEHYKDKRNSIINLVLQTKFLNADQVAKTDVPGLPKERFGFSRTLDTPH